uniref:Uncharacterized protein n=1 Tax=Moniliophthora roreri TaxID=221103 RepID=A0A0W0FJQ3_MONRR
MAKNTSNNISDIHQTVTKDKDDEDPEDDTLFDIIPNEMKTDYLTAYRDMWGHFPELHTNLVNCIVYDDEEMLTVLINMVHASVHILLLSMIKSLQFREGFHQACKNNSLKLKKKALQYLLMNLQVEIDNKCCDPHIDPSNKHDHGLMKMFKNLCLYYENMRPVVPKYPQKRYI